MSNIRTPVQRKKLAEAFLKRAVQNFDEVKNHKPGQTDRNKYAPLAESGRYSF